MSIDFDLDWLVFSIKAIGASNHGEPTIFLDRIYHCTANTRKIFVIVNSFSEFYSVVNILAAKMDATISLWNIENHIVIGSVLTNQLIRCILFAHFTLAWHHHSPCDIG